MVTVATLSLGFLKAPGLLTPYEYTSHLCRLALEVQITPLQGQELFGPHSRKQCELKYQTGRLFGACLKETAASVSSSTRRSISVTFGCLDATN